jgi:hypothetical protein
MAEQAGDRDHVENGVVGRVRGIMLRRVRPIMIAAGGVAAALVLCASLLDLGEVVTLHTTDSQSRSYETQLWIVDLDEERYLRAGRPGVRWLSRLRQSPGVVLERDGEERTVRAYPEEDVSVRDRVNAAMAEKYGLADRLIRMLNDANRSVPVRLEPADEVHANRSVEEKGRTP